MAGRGPAPKDPERRVRRNKTDAPVVVVPDGQTHGPELPDGVEWATRTRAWWDTWRASPLAQAFTPTDWDFLLDTALLHSELWLGNGSVAAELRLRVAKFGATPEDRNRLKLQIGEPDITPGQRKPSSRYSHLRSVVSE